MSCKKFRETEDIAKRRSVTLARLSRAMRIGRQLDWYCTWLGRLCRSDIVQPPHWDKPIATQLFVSCFNRLSKRDLEIH